MAVKNSNIMPGGVQQKKRMIFQPPALNKTKTDLKT